MQMHAYLQDGMGGSGWTPELAASRLAPKFWKAAQAGDIAELERCHPALACAPAHHRLQVSDSGPSSPTATYSITLGDPPAD